MAKFTSFIEWPSQYIYIYISTHTHTHTHTHMEVNNGKESNSLELNWKTKSWWWFIKTEMAWTFFHNKFITLNYFVFRFFCVCIYIYIYIYIYISHSLTHTHFLYFVLTSNIGMEPATSPRIIALSSRCSRILSRQPCNKKNKSSF